MIVPYTKPQPRPQLAWMLDATRAITEDHDYVVARDFNGQVWASADLVWDLLRDRHGEALTWEGHPIKWHLQRGEPWYVRVLQIPHPDRPEDVASALSAWADWLHSYGAAPQGSLGGSGFSLLKATLPDPLWTSVGELPPIRFVVGGRQVWGVHGSPAIFEGSMTQWDMRAAYASTLGGMRYGGRWKRWSASYPFYLDADNGLMVFIRARVKVPDKARFASVHDVFAGPLLRRPRRERDLFEEAVWPTEYPVNVTIQGVWTWPELIEAGHAGCDYTILDGWVHEAPPDMYPFADWWAAVQQGREMDGFAGTLAKATGNATWGQFSIRSSGHRGILSRTPRGKRDYKRLHTRNKGNPSQRAPDLAEYLCGVVRSRLFRGMRIAAGRMICAHTDGIWVLGDDVIVPGWRRKQAAKLMRFDNPQCLAFTYRGSEEYVVAGVHANGVRDWFEQRWSQILQQHAPKPYAMNEKARAGDPIPVIRHDGDN